MIDSGYGRLLVVIDGYRKRLEVFPMSSTTTERLRVIFAQFGLPEVIVSDNGTNFVSNALQEFLQRNRVRQVTTAPGHPSSTVLVERAVRTFKECSMTAQLSRFLFTYGNTPHPTTGCRLRSALDLMKPDLEGRVLVEQFRQAQKHDELAQAREFCVGDENCCYDCNAV